jgi:phosphatidylserine/phosphatidylglycerophosphate/cardiolipin synthase-like enzyme
VGVPIFIDAQPAIAHNKVIIIDNRILLTGSYNWTRAAELRNAENLLVIRDKELVRQYADNFQRRLLKAKKHNPIVSKTSK